MRYINISYSDDTKGHLTNYKKYIKFYVLYIKCSSAYEIYKKYIKFYKIYKL
jgi:hypothetical protein